MTNGWKVFKKYAIEHNIHDGQSTMLSLEQLYDKHKGSRYHTIVEIFKKQGQINFLKEYYEGV